MSLVSDRSKCGQQSFMTLLGRYDHQSGSRPTYSPIGETKSFLETFRTPYRAAKLFGFSMARWSELLRCVPHVNSRVPSSQQRWAFRPLRSSASGLFVDRKSLALPYAVENEICAELLYERHRNVLFRSVDAESRISKGAQACFTEVFSSVAMTYTIRIKIRMSAMPPKDR